MNDLIDVGERELDKFQRLSDANSDEVFALLSEGLEGNVILLHNMRVFGMDPGRTGFNGEYFGRRRDGELVAVGAVFNLGSMFLYARDEEAVEGMAEYVAGLEALPGVVHGKASIVDRLFDHEPLMLKAGTRLYLDLMVLRENAVHEDIETAGARLSLAEDLDDLVELQLGMEREAFGEAPVDEWADRELLATQVSRGAAYLLEVDGSIVSKAEATSLERVGSWLGGVYTRPDSRGRGHSTRCVAALCLHLLENAPFVALTVDKDNHAARAVYHRIGFEKVDDWAIARIYPP